MTKRTMYSKRELAERLGLSQSYINHNLGNEAKLPKHRKVGSLVKFRVCDVEQFEDRLPYRP